jgi:hypothetical protein
MTNQKNKIVLCLALLLGMGSAFAGAPACETKNEKACAASCEAVEKFAAQLSPANRETFAKLNQDQKNEVIAMTKSGMTPEVALEKVQKEVK